MKRIAFLQNFIQDWQSLNSKINDSLELAGMEEESFQKEIEATLIDLEKEIEKRELSILLSGPYDTGNAILAIHAGAGGTDSQDWAAMLERMYLRWADRKGYKIEILDRTDGEEAGIKTVTISIEGFLAYGYLKNEKGVHRLVRLSPFDAAHRRHTSFALVEVLPELDETAEIVIPPDDIRIEVYKYQSRGSNVQKKH